MIKISCRKGCAACCIAPSISSSIPGMPQGKPAGVRCVQLSPENLCSLFSKPERPDVCNSYQATEESCGRNHIEALQLLTLMEKATS